jgi:hypothetical protein
MVDKLKSEKPSSIELHPDAWERFRTAVHVMTKAGPQHREPKPAKKSQPSKTKKRKGK